MSLKYCQVTLQTTIKSQKYFNCKRHKYMENKGIVSYFSLDVCYYFKLYIHFYKLFFTTYVDNNFFNIVYDQICFQWIFKI